MSEINLDEPVVRDVARVAIARIQEGVFLVYELEGSSGKSHLKPKPDPIGLLTNDYISFA